VGFNPTIILQTAAHSCSSTPGISPAFFGTHCHFRDFVAERAPEVKTRRDVGFGSSIAFDSSNQSIISQADCCKSLPVTEELTW
jgi:hypothetical protein